MASPIHQERRLSRDSSGQSPHQSQYSIASNVQPTYDFLTGETTLPSAPVFRHTFRQSKTVKPNIDNEDLRAQIKTLQYEVESFKQERDLTDLRHEKELRDVQAKGEAEFKRTQASVNTKRMTAKQYEALAKELRDVQDQFMNQQQELEKTIRSSRERNRSLQEEVNEAQAELSSRDRQYHHRIQEVESNNALLKTKLGGLQEDFESQSSTLRETQDKLLRREIDIAAVESELLELKAQSRDLEDFATVKRELSEQMSHIRKLEKTNREQTTKLRHFRQVHEAVEIVEEERKKLERKVHQMEDLQRELSESQMQRQIFEDERKSWTTYLDSVSSDGKVEFDSPEGLTRALAQERLEKASMAERLGVMQPEVSEKEEIVKTLEAERQKMQAELKYFKSSAGSSDNRSKARLERQKGLAIKEVEYLREQLRTFDNEDFAGEPGNDSGKHNQNRIYELEGLVSQYRNEIQTLSNELTSREEHLKLVETPSLKRPLDDEPDERMGQLSRKNRKLQAELSTIRQSSSMLQKELSAATSQLASLQASSRTRILSLRSNPSDDFQNLKFSTIKTLREENKALLSRLEGAPHNPKLVPSSSLESAKLEIQELEKIVTEKEKRMLRLKQIWSLKSLEFREAVASLLGWKMDFMPNGRFRMTSIFYPGTLEDGGDSGENLNSIIFDGETGTMKISGGPTSDFATEIRGLIRFWVEERKEIPGFLAACTLEFYEKTTRAQKI